MADIHASLSFNLDTGLLQAAIPLIEAEQVDGLEWSFDTLYAHDALPDWFDEFLNAFGNEGRLVGHGVFFSLFSGRWLPEQAHWLQELRSLTQRFRFDHVSEHFGFLTGADFHKGAPLSVPLTAATLAIGQDRLMRIADACGCPVGLENLAFATNGEAARIHGAFLEQLVAPVNGFLILDLHNLYCQQHNFGLGADVLLSHYPLERVREIHISGGSWEPSPFRAAPGVRRDTHDDRVPEEVFALLAAVLPRLPNIRFVVMEHMGFALHSPELQADYRADYLQMRALVTAENLRRKSATPTLTESFLPTSLHFPADPLEDAALYAEQRLLAQILENSDTPASALAGLQASALAHSAWQIETWEPAMLETARLIARKWKDGFYG